ncbi:MAG: hypothetical protein ACO1SX_13880 [Actinomycetota bacterium]
MRIPPAVPPERDAERITSELRAELAHGMNLCRVIATLPYGERSVLARLTRQARDERRRRELREEA